MMHLRLPKGRVNISCKDIADTICLGGTTKAVLGAGTYVEINTLAAHRAYGTRTRAVETWLKDVPEHRKEALEFERLLGLRKGIKHKNAPLLNVREAKNLMEIRAKGNERNTRKLEKFKKLAPRQQTKALWYSANKAPLLRQKVIAQQLQEKIDVFGFDPDSKEGKQRLRALNAAEDLRTLGPQSAPLLSSGEVRIQSPTDDTTALQLPTHTQSADTSATPTHPHTRLQALQQIRGADRVAPRLTQNRQRHEGREKIWIGDSYDVDLDAELANLEPIPLLTKQERRDLINGKVPQSVLHTKVSDDAALTDTHRAIQHDRERASKPTYVTVQSQKKGVVPPERGSKRMRKIRKYLDPEEAFYNPDLAYKKAKKKADKAATRWKNRGISWAQINANLPPGVEPGPRKPKGWDRKEPPKAVKMEWEPTKRLTRPVMDKVRKLREENRMRWTTVALADRFKVSPEAIHRILRSKWTPDAQQYKRQMDRTLADYEMHSQAKRLAAQQTPQAAAMGED